MPTRAQVVEEVLTPTDDVPVQSIFSLDIFDNETARFDTNQLTSGQLSEELTKRNLLATGTKLEKLVRLEEHLQKTNPASRDPKAKSVQVASIKKLSWLQETKKPLPPAWR